MDYKYNKDYQSPWIEEPESTVDYLSKLLLNYKKNFLKDEFLFRQDQLITDVYIIKSGRVRYSVYSEHGDETHRMIGKPGCFFGDVSFFDNHPENGNLSCIVDCEVFVVPRYVMKDLLSKNSDFYTCMINSICRKYRTLEHLIYEYTSKNAYSRVITQLLNLAKSHGVNVYNKIKIDITFTHADMSYITFLSRVSVSNIMIDLQKKGYIEKIDGFLYINNLNKLNDLLLEMENH